MQGAERRGALFGPEDFAARLGGDEMALTETAAVEDMATIAAVRQPGVKVAMDDCAASAAG